MPTRGGTVCAVILAWCRCGRLASNWHFGSAILAAASCRFLHSVYGGYSIYLCRRFARARRFARPGHGDCDCGRTVQPDPGRAVALAGVYGDCIYSAWSLGLAAFTQRLG